MDNKRVLVLAEYGWRNGGENSFLAIASLLQQKGWGFVVACPQQTELSKFLAEINIESVGWNVFHESRIRKTQEQIRNEIEKLIAEIKPAIVHCNSLSTGRLAGPTANHLSVPSVGYLRDIVKLSKKAIEDINQLAVIIAVSEATKRFHVEQGIDANKVPVVYNGVNLEQFMPRKPTGYLHGQLGFDRNCRIVTCIGQIGLRKGTDTIITSFVELSNEFDDLALIIVGIRNSAKQESIDFEKHCRQLCDTSPARERIFWLGRRTDVAKILNESSLLLHGARQEPLGRVLLEAAACGCPFVATEVGGTAEIVLGTECAHLTCADDAVDEMTANARRLLNDGNLAERVGQELRKIATSRFDANRCAGNLHDIYCDLLSGSRTGS